MRSLQRGDTDDQHNHHHRYYEREERSARMTVYARIISLMHNIDLSLLVANAPYTIIHTYMRLANTTANQRERLGCAGMALLDVLENMADGPVFATSLRQELTKAGIERARPHELDDDDDRFMEELIVLIMPSLDPIT